MSNRRAGDVEGLGLLPGETTFAREKSTHRVRAQILGGSGWLGALAGEVVAGYEIHMGQTPRRTPLAPHRPRGCVGRILVRRTGGRRGAYLGLLLARPLRQRRIPPRLVGSLDGGQARPGAGLDHARFQESLDRLAHIVEESLNMEELERIIREPA